MRIAAVGVGQAGGKILDRLLEYDRRWGYGFVTSATAFNTARADLNGLRTVPPERRILIGRTKVHGHGVGADNELGTEVARADREIILGAVDDINVGETDAFLVIAALGGGTGSGAGPVIARELKDIYGKPVYALGVLPGRDEGGIYTLNAARSFKTFVNEADNLLVFDNDAWRRPGETLESGYESINDEIVRRFGVLFSAGQVSADGAVGENVVDASELDNTLSVGGVTSVGHAAEQVDTQASGLLDRFRDGSEGPQNDDVTERITGLVRQAVNGRLTLPAGVESTERALVVISGPPHHLSRRGTELGRDWLAETTDSMEVRGGDHPLPNEETVAATAVLAGVTDVPRIEALQRSAVDANSHVREREARRDDELRALLADERDELDPLI